MNKPLARPLFMRSTGARRRMIGVVLPVVLVVLTVLTGLIVAQVRRGAIDERLAANATETVMLDSAAQTVLRWCEARIVSAPLDTAVVVPGFHDAGLAHGSELDPDRQLAGLFRRDVCCPVSTRTRPA